MHTETLQKMFAFKEVNDVIQLQFLMHTLFIPYFFISLNKIFVV